jgi:hypothetical protein
MVKRTERQFIGRGPGRPRGPGVPAWTLTLSVLLCIGALADGQAAAAVVAQSLDRHGTTANERESVASLLSSLNDAARKLCRHQHTGQVANTAWPPAGLPIGEDTAALGPYDAPVRCDSRPAMLDHLLNLPPPVATF